MVILLYRALGPDMVLRRLGERGSLADFIDNVLKLPLALSTQPVRLCFGMAFPDRDGRGTLRYEHIFRMRTQFYLFGSMILDGVSRV